MRIAVVDDEALARARLERLLGAMDDVELAPSCDGGDALLALLRTDVVDALMLDVRMPGLDGMELAALLKDRNIPVVFVTAYTDHAVDAFEVGALDYLLKPVSAARLRLAVERLLQQRASSAERLAVETANGVVLVEPNDIVFASFDGQLVTLHLQGASPLKQVHTDWSLNGLLSRVPVGLLERVHRRCLLNLNHVQRLERAPTGGYVAYTQQGGEVEVSRQAGRRLRKRFGW